MHKTMFSKDNCSNWNILLATDYPNLWFAKNHTLCGPTMAKQTCNYWLRMCILPRLHMHVLHLCMDYEYIVSVTCSKNVIQAERVEKERMKRVVLDIHERQEEEDYQGMPILIPSYNDIYYILWPDFMWYTGKCSPNTYQINRASGDQSVWHHNGYSLWHHNG